jgi:serine protease
MSSEVVMKLRIQPIRAVASVCAAVLSLSAASALAQTVQQGVIVKFKPRLQLLQSGETASAARALSDTQARYGISMRTMRTIATGAEVIELDRNLPQAELDDLIATLKNDPAVEYAEEDKRMYALFTPNDPSYSQQWHYFEAAGGLNLPPAWDITNGSGVRVAVLDTGFRPHADLAANLVGGYDFISSATVAGDGDGRDGNAIDPGDFTAGGRSSWHGTHVSGTIAAVTNNGAGVAGVAFGAKVVPVRVLGRGGGSTADIADAIIWASGGTVPGVPTNPNPARVINMSLGGGGACGTTTQNAINSARSRGTVVVVAAGNSNTNVSTATPANCAGVVAVAAVGRTGGRASYSNFGALVDVAAPGGDQRTGQANGVLSTLNAGATTPGADSLAFYQGTSMATPHTAGAVALMLSVNSSLTPDQVESILRSTARAFPATCGQCGTGIVNALAAVNAARGNQPPPPPPPPTGGNVLQNGVPVTGISLATNQQLRFSIVVPSGRSRITFTTTGPNGDADLYVRFNALPTTTTFNCKSDGVNSNESCGFSTSVPAGTYNILLNGFAAATGVSLTATYQ